MDDFTLEPAESGKKKKKKNNGNDTLHTIWEIVKTILIVAVAFVFIRYFILQPFLVVGSSMESNFHDGEYIIVNEWNYHLMTPRRGDVVVFKHPSEECTQFVEASYINKRFLQGPCNNFIKRVVGLPGETIEIIDGNIRIYNSDIPKGFELDESEYITKELFGNQKVDLKKNEFYVVGDNRDPNGSSDSREWGPLPREFITGKASLVVLPLPDFEFIKRPSY